MIQVVKVQLVMVQIILFNYFRVKVQQLCMKHCRSMRFFLGPTTCGKPEQPPNSTLVAKVERKFVPWGGGGKHPPNG